MRALLPKLTRSNRIVAMHRLNAHAHGCSICIGESEARDRALRPQISDEDWEHTPWWLAPVFGALALGFLSFLKIGWVLLWGWIHPPTAFIALKYLLGTMAIGGAGGLVFSIVYAAIGRVWWARYPSAVAAIAVPALLIKMVADYTNILGAEPRKWSTVAIMVVSVLYGVFLAHEAHDPKETERAA